MKWIKDLHVRQESVKLTEENIGKTLFDINCSSIFFFFLHLFQSKGDKSKNKQMGSSYCGSAVTNPTSNHEDMCSIPGFVQWVKGSGVAMSCGVGQQLQLQFDA